jgi:type VI protein secretion system component VasK
LNGVAVLIPYGAAENDRLANQVAALAQRDLETVQQTLRVRCPLVTIVCDLQEAPGCREMIQMFPEEQRHRRLGVRFPLMCNDPSANVTQMIDKGVRWICRDLLPPLVYRLMRGTNTSGQTPRNLSPTNVKLYRFLDDIRQREQRLGRMMRQIFTAGNEKYWLPAGCYLVANGADVAREQGFAAGVLPQLYQMQNLLAWTPEALSNDQGRRYWVWAGYTALGICVGLLGLAMLRLC